MKFNWGHGITIFILLFMAFILTLVYKMHYRNADLVNDDFYEESLVLNDKKKSISNYKKLDFELILIQTEKGIEIVFPENYKIDKGDIHFYRAEDKALDKKYQLILNNQSKHILPYTDFIVGGYEVYIKWKKDEISYLFESEIKF